MHSGVHRRSAVVSALVVTLILGLGSWMFVRWRVSGAGARLPGPPAAAAQSKAVAAHLAAKYDAARREPSSPAAIGALCVAYHADMFFDEAERCYGLVSELDS